MKRLQQLQLNREKQERQQRIIAQTMKNLEDKLHKQEIDYHNKQTKKEEKLRQYENLRLIAFKNNKEKAMNKSQEIQRVITKNIDREREKVENYYKKQEEIAKRKAELEGKNQLEIQKKLENNRQQEQKIQDVLKHNEEMLEEKKSSIIFKIQKTEAVVMILIFYQNIRKIE